MHRKNGLDSPPVGDVVVIDERAYVLVGRPPS